MRDRTRRKLRPSQKGRDPISPHLGQPADLAVARALTEPTGRLVKNFQGVWCLSAECRANLIQQSLTGWWGVPDVRRLLQRRGDHALALGVEPRGIDIVLMLQWLSDRLPGAGVPDARRLVQRRGDHALALGVQRRGKDLVLILALSVSTG
jgi:hypothetical protein